MLEKLLAASRTRLFWLSGALALSVVFATLHFFAVDNFWYWKYRWFDIPMHVLGGVTVGVSLVGLFVSRRPLVFVAVVTIVVVGWEVMEYMTGLTREPGYWFDTWHDLLDDSVGAILAYLLARLTIWHSA